MKSLNEFSLAATIAGEFSGNVTSYSGKASRALHVVSSGRSFETPLFPPFRPAPPGPAPAEFAKTDGWLAGPESDALAHDKTHGFGDGAPALQSPA
jgi:hypothetical protein